MSAATRTFKQLSQRLLLITGVVCLVPACGSSPPARHVERHQSQERVRDDERTLLAIPSPPIGDNVYYNLAPAAVSTDQITNVQPYPRESLHPISNSPTAEKTASRAMAPIADPKEIDPADIIAKATDTTLVEELQSRWTRALALNQGRSELPARLETARRGLALSFLSENQGTGSVDLVQAAKTACEEGSTSDLRLLAAAYYARVGMQAEAEDSMAGLFESTSDSERDQELAYEDLPQDAFEVARLSFSSSIEGPGKFVPIAPGDLSSGKSVLIYGEFRNFKNEASATTDSRTIYRSSFSASLRLMSSTGDLIDRLEFLPESRGQQHSPTRSDVTNFWARYKIPANVRPGVYTLVVEARDLLGGGSASGEIAFTLGDKNSTAQPPK